MEKALILCFAFLALAFLTMHLGFSEISMTGFIALVADNEEPMLPGENLIIVETSPSGLVMEKRIAEDADLIFTRELKVKARMSGMTITDYENEIIITLKNVSDRNLQNIAILERIPDKIYSNAIDINSYIGTPCIKDNKVMRFDIENLKIGEIKSVNYYIIQDTRMTEKEFLELQIPLALVNLERGSSCVGTYCNDYNPCTRDYCEKGVCKYVNATDGLECEGDKVCKQGQCITTGEMEAMIKTETEQKNQDLLLPFAAILVMGIIVLLVFRNKKT